MSTVLNDLVSKFETSVGRVQTVLHNLVEMRANGRDLITKQCEFMRENVQIVTESKIDEIQKASAALIDRLNDYEQKCLHALQEAEADAVLTARLDSALHDATVFTNKWLKDNSEPKKCKIDDAAMTDAIEHAEVQLKKLADCERLVKGSRYLKGRHVKFNNKEEVLSSADLGVIQVESPHIGKVNDANDGQLDMSLIEVEQIKHIFRLANGKYFANKVVVNGPFLLFDSNGAFLENIIQPNLLNENPLSVCSFGNCVAMICPYFSTSIKVVMMVINMDNDTDVTINEVVLEDNVPLDKVPLVGLQYHITANSNSIVCYIGDKTTPLSVYDWSLKKIKEIGQNGNEHGPYFIPRFENRKPSQISVSPDGSRLLMISCERDMRLINLETGALIIKFELPIYLNYSSKCPSREIIWWTPDEFIMRTIDGDTLYVYDLNGEFLYKNRFCDCLDDVEPLQILLDFDDRDTSDSDDEDFNTDDDDDSEFTSTDQSTDLSFTSGSDSDNDADDVHNVPRNCKCRNMELVLDVDNSLILVNTNDGKTYHL